MKEKNLNQITLEDPQNEFKKFLTNENNKRIFFSGKFGVGKTYFLDSYFKENESEYDIYHLFPVRYQIGSTENIIELLKYDILVSLLKNNPEAFENNKKGGIKETYKLFLAFGKDRGLINRFLKSTVSTGEGVLSLSPDPFFQTLSKLGRPLDDLLTLDKEFQEFKKEYLAGEKGIIEKFIKEVETERDIIATDYVSHLLKEKIAAVKVKKKSVLILDDFDRIDPEHIFRILNILSAHMEGDEDNKFGFDHVIIVGDVRNLMSIFHHRYGEKTEFWGYFDKFFTVRPFEFDNQKAVANAIPRILLTIQCGDENLKAALSQDGIVKNLLEEILLRASQMGLLSLRQQYRPVNHPFPEMGSGVYTNNPFTNQRHQFLDIAIKLLVAVYGNEANFLEKLKLIRDKSNNTDTEKHWFYKIYASSMLEQMINIKQEAKQSWLEKYTIIAKPDHSLRGVDIILDGDQLAHARFFYDTFIEYVEKSKYIKRNWQEYST